MSAELSLIRAARALVGHRADHGLTIVIITNKHRVEFAADAEDVQRATGPPPSDGGSLAWLRSLFFSDEEAGIIKALGSEELAAANIATRVGSEPTTRLRTLLANLADRGVLVSATSGYRVADPRVLSLFPRADDVPTDRP